MLDFDRHCWIAALHIRRRAQHRIDIGDVTACAFQSITAGGNADFRHHRNLVIWSFSVARLHDVGIEYRSLVHDMPRLDTARLLDKFDRAVSQRLGIRIGCIIPVSISVEAGDQFFVADRIRWCEQSGRGYNRYCSLAALRHEFSRFL